MSHGIFPWMHDILEQVFLRCLRISDRLERVNTVPSLRLFFRIQISLVLKTYDWVVDPRTSREVEQQR